MNTIIKSKAIKRTNHYKNDKLIRIAKIYVNVDLQNNIILEILMYAKAWNLKKDDGKVIKVFKDNLLVKNTLCFKFDTFQSIISAYADCINSPAHIIKYDTIVYK